MCYSSEMMAASSCAAQIENLAAENAANLDRQAVLQDLALQMEGLYSAESAAGQYDSTWTGAEERAHYAAINAHLDSAAAALGYADRGGLINALDEIIYGD